MGGGFWESKTNNEPPPQPGGPSVSGCGSSSSSGGGSSNDSGSFECNICFELAQDPIVTLCGHLFCWPCLYKWLHVHSNSQECPVCKAMIEEEKLVPLYGRGKTPTDPRSKSIPGINIPNRPAGQRPGTAAPPPPNPPNPFADSNPWFMGAAPIGGMRFGNYTFSAAIGGLLPFLNFQVHGFHGANAYIPPAAGFPYGSANPFQGGHAHGLRQQMSQGDRADYTLVVLLLAVFIMVYASFKIA